MTMTTFNGYTVHSRRLSREFREGTNVHEWTFDCITATSTAITDLCNLMGPVVKTRLLSGKTLIQTTGTKGTLVFNGSSYSNCVIESLTREESADSFVGAFPYSISIAQETYTST